MHLGSKLDAVARYRDGQLERPPLTAEERAEIVRICDERVRDLASKIEGADEEFARSVARGRPPHGERSAALESRLALNRAARHRPEPTILDSPFRVEGGPWIDDAGESSAAVTGRRITGERA